MTTIDRLDVSIYFEYARRTQMIEEIAQQYHLEEAEHIPPQTRLVDIFPRLSEMDLLLGVIRCHAPWAEFAPPKKFATRRQSHFGFHRVAPSLGSPDKQEACLEELEAMECQSKEDEKARNVLIACFNQLEKLNDMLNFIVGRIGQFLQG